MKLFVVEERELWGDYGHVLISGYVQRRGQDSMLLLHRAGPFLPPISFPSGSLIGTRVIVSEPFRRELEAKGFPGLQFRQAVKDRIVDLPWHQWDLAAGDPKHYPFGGEPEDYIWNEPHDVKAATEMPDAWELSPPVVPLKIDHLKNPGGRYLNQYRGFPEDSSYPDLFTNQESWGKLIVGEAVRDWLEEQVGDWIFFCDVEIAEF